MSHSFSQRNVSDNLLIETIDIICQFLLLTFQVLHHCLMRFHHEPTIWAFLMGQCQPYILPTPLYRCTSWSMVEISLIVNWRIFRSRSLELICCVEMLSARCDWTAVCWICTKIWWQISWIEYISHQEYTMKSDLAQRFIWYCGHHKQQEMKDRTESY